MFSHAVMGMLLLLAETPPNEDPQLQQYGFYEQSAPRAQQTEPVDTELPLKPRKGMRVALIGNTLFERMQHHGTFESLLQRRFPTHQLVVRNLAWAADTPTVQPRPENFADQIQHLTHEKADLILAAYGFNESFAGSAGEAAFRESLTAHVRELKTRSFNGEFAPNVVLVSPIANENVPGFSEAEANNARIKSYAEVMRHVAREQRVGFVDVFTPMLAAMRATEEPLTINGCHLNDTGYRVFAKVLFTGLTGETPPTIDEAIRTVVVDKNTQYFYRYRPANTFYYTGGRRQQYGYLDFLPAMRNFDLLVANRDRRIWQLAAGEQVPTAIDDSNLPPLPRTAQSRGANQWVTAAEERKAFQVDPRFEVTLFAGEEEFPDIAAPIQIRWDNQGRLWVSCSTTYPHVYPGNAPQDKLVVLEDTDQDGRADRSTVFADDLHIPLSFEFGDGGVYVSEMPYLTFLKDTDGDGRADVRRRLLSGFGTEDSHHALHDFTWTPDGDLIFREGIFHHSQVETPHGPVRQQNSGWFRFEPHHHRLTSFGTYHSTNPWGVTFDDWGQHMASHPVYAAAFHALDPPYPQQHPKPTGLQAYSGTCGQEFVDFATFPTELQGHFIKVRYKPTNRVEIHRWMERQYGFDEEYVGDLIFSTNLSFIPVDIRFGPRGALYVCDWYNPIKGHAQYSLRDERRDRHSGRIWRITAKDKPLQSAPQIAKAPLKELLELLKRPEYRVRYWAKRELRERDADEVAAALAEWVRGLDRSDSRLRHHQLEAVWVYRGIDRVHADLLRELLACDQHLARAAATEQLRFWHSSMPDALEWLRRAVNDTNGIVRMQGVIAASYIGSREALEVALDVYEHPHEGHLSYAIATALGSHPLRRHWENDPSLDVARRIRQAGRRNLFKEPTPSASEAEFDRRPDLATVKIGCVSERMRFTVETFVVQPGQPVKLVFTNPDATDHNLVFVKPGAVAEVGMAANAMARDPKNANSNFIPKDKKHLIVRSTPMIGPTRRSLVHVLRFAAPDEAGVYPYVCTFPGHWVIMTGVMVVAESESQAEALLAARQPAIVREWKFDDFAEVRTSSKEPDIMRGMQAFVKARCDQCHAVGSHGVNLGPDLKETAKKLKGLKLLQQVVQPSSEINEKYRNVQFLMNDGRIVTGVIVKESDRQVHIVSNLLNPTAVTRLAKKQIDERIPSQVSPMPVGLINVLDEQEIMDLLSFLESGDYPLPGHLKKHDH